MPSQKQEVTDEAKRSLGHVTEYNYKLTNMGESSTKLGPCEVCGKHVTEVWHLQEERQYTRPDETTGWTQADCKNLFGHLKCLEGVRR